MVQSIRWCIVGARRGNSDMLQITRPPAYTQHIHYTGITDVERSLFCPLILLPNVRMCYNLTALLI